jgi:hypothetical protein
MANAELVCYTFGTHFTIMEYPADIARRLSIFLQVDTTDGGRSGRSRVAEPSAAKGSGNAGGDVKR